MRLILILLMLLPLGLKAKEGIEILIPETYELSNVILALTDYGISDPWEVQKATPYYNEIMTYFESVKNHPLLDSVNYSREKWEYYLSFRTDAFAFEFDENNRLKRTNKFYATGLNAFDKNIDLVNDFVEKSNFRQFYKEHIPLYEEIISNYKEFYLINETRTFLDDKIGKPKHRAN